MSYPQTLIRKRRAMDETIGGLTVAELLRRVGPLLESDSPPVRAVQPANTSQIPVTDSLPPIRQGTGVRPEAIESVLDYSPTRVAPSNVMPIRPLPVDEPAQRQLMPPVNVPNEPSVAPIRPSVEPVSEVPAWARNVTPGAPPIVLPPGEAPVLSEQRVIRPDTPIAPPVSMIADANATRPLRALPMTPERQLQGDMEGLAALKAAPKDYGHDSQGNPRIKPRGGVLGTLGSMAKTAGYRALDAITHGGNPILAAGVGLAEGGFNRGAPAAIRRQHEIQGLEGKVGKDLAIVKAQGGIQDDSLDRTYRRAQIDALNRKATQGPKLTIRSDAQGRLVSVNPETGELKVLNNVKKTSVPRTVWANGQLLIQDPETRQYEPATTKDGQEITDDLRTPTEIEIGGETFKVSPNTKAMAIATGERARVEQVNRQSQQTGEWERREEDRLAKEQEDYDAAEAFNADLNRRIEAKKVEQRQNEEAAANSQYSDEREKAQTRADHLRDEIGQMEGQRKYARKPTPARSAPRSTPYSPPRSAGPSYKPKADPEGLYN